MDNFLKKIPFFANLPASDLESLCKLVTEVSLPAGEILFTEGSPGDKAYIIKQGQLEILKASGGSNVLLAVRQSGDVIGEMSLLESAPRFATARARSDCILLVIEHQHLDHFLNTSPSAAKAMLHTITNRLRSTEVIIRQSEKMAQLGTMTAGIAHELYNPVAAIGRGADQLKDVIGRWQQSQFQLSQLALSETQKEGLQTLDELVKERARHPADLDLLGRSDQEEQMETWLDQQGVQDGWEFAPLLVSLGYDAGQLNQLTETFQADSFSTVVQWLESTFSLYSLLEEINQGSRQMSTIITVLKSYVYLDQAPVQLVDIHSGLDNTLVLLRSRLKEGITVKRDYDPQLPRIQAYGSELNQVWTNIIANAIDSLGDQGELILRTSHTAQAVCVEFQDNGPGIPADIQPQLFSPFFTTKPMGKGTGLGLNISYNIVKKHGGEIKFFSEPGLTNFVVTLPVNFEAMATGEEPISGVEVPSDEDLLSIMTSAHTIAVVGISDRPDVPAHTIPAYLQKAGYRIYPVNPRLDSVLGEKAYPDLHSIEQPIDIVLVFRRSEFVPEIVQQAIQINARVVWMQEGIIHEGAALVAKNAGLKVVMNTCLGATHRRLLRA